MTQASKNITIDSIAKPSINPLLIGLSVFGLFLVMSFSLHAYADATGKIVKWKDEMALKVTAEKRPDLLKKVNRET